MFSNSDSKWYKYRWLFVGLLILVIAIIAIYLVDHKKVVLDENKSTIVFSFKENGKSTEVRSVEPDKQLVLYVNGTAGDVVSLLPQKLDSVVTLPSVKGINDITSTKEPTYALTWTSSLTESSMYMNFLASQGYKVVREVHTSQFIEEILELNGIKKRILIYNNIIMVGDLQKDAKLPDLSQYLKKYRN